MKTKSDHFLSGYCDSDFAGDEQSNKSTTGYVILYYGTLFHWKTQLQRHVSLSSTEAEVIALCTLTKEIAWIRRMIIELKLVKGECAQIYCDNTSAIKIAQSDHLTQRTRHLRAQSSYIKEQIDEKEIQVRHVSTHEQLSDFLTKALPTKAYIINRDKLMSSCL